MASPSADPAPRAADGAPAETAQRTPPSPAPEHHHRNVQGGAARAAVFGVSDGLVSNVALVLGMAAADPASWPQAASMSVPRLRRTVAFTPSDRNRARKARTPASGVPRAG